MINKKNLDRSFDAIYTLKKRNLIAVTGKGKKPMYSSDDILLTRQTGLETILANSVTNPTYELWIKFNVSIYNSPGPMDTDGQGNFFIGNIYASKITKVDSNGNLLAQYYPPNGSVSTFTTDGWPWGLAYYNGDLYLSDMSKQFIYKFNPPTSTWTTIIGTSGTSGFTSGLVGTSSLIYGPMGILSDGTGNLYICQADNHVISKYVISTGILTTFAGTGVPGYADGPGNTAQFNNQNGMFFDNSGNIIVVDTGNNRIRKINIITRVVTTIAGTGVAGSLDGPALSATFDGPMSGCCDSNGNFYIIDAGNLIRKISNGIVTTMFGSPTAFGNIASLLYYQNYVYVSVIDNSNTYRFAV